MSSRIPRIAFKTINECTIYLKDLPIGAKCILLGGPIVGASSRMQFLRRGLDVKVEGLHGNRIVTSAGIDDHYVEKYRKWRNGVNEDGENISFDEADAGGLTPGESVFVNSKHTELIEALRKAYGAGCYSCSKATDPKYGVGWMVKHLTKEEQNARKELKRIQDEKRVRGAATVAELNSRMTTAKAMGAGIDVGASVFVQSPKIKIRDHLRLRFKAQTFIVEEAKHATLGDCFKVTRTA
jgi:hypothetical protein